MENENQITDSAGQDASQRAVETAAPADSAAQVATLTTERDLLVEQKAELNDLLLRRQAEFDNFRRRVARERSEILEFASMESLGALLPVLDDFERALLVECTDKEYSKGMALIYQGFFDTLKKLGLEPISTENEAFDPHVHHAVESVETEEVEDHTIVAEFQRGYNFKGQLLRPAMVKVAVKPQSKQ